MDEAAEQLGDTIIELATAVRRFKSEQSLSVGQALVGLGLVCADEELLQGLLAAATDIQSITRAQSLTIGSLENSLVLDVQPGLQLAVLM